MPIEIIIKNTETQGTESISSPANPLGDQNGNQENDGKKVNGKKSPMKVAMTNLIISQAKAWATAGVQSYIKYTGNSILQEKIDVGMSIVGDLTTIGVAVATGNAPMVVVAVATTVAKMGMNAFNQGMAIKTENRNLSINQLGMGNRNVNGGRYGA